MKRNYSVLIEYSPAYELIISLYTYIYNKNLKSIKLGKDWVEETKLKLPTRFALELEDERWEILHRTVLLISQCPEKKTVEEFLDWLEQLPAGELYERLSPWVSSIPLNLGEVRDRILYLLTEWNTHYFKSLDTGILDYLQDEVRFRQEEAQTCSPIDLIERVTNGMRVEPTDQLKQVILIPQYHCYPTTVMDYFRGMATCLYPIKETITSKEESSLVILQLTQCLADEKRLGILSYIAEKPRTLIEIHQHIKLAKSTVHHHITILRKAGIIRSHFIDHSTPAYYSLRESFIDRLNTELRSFLFKKGDLL
ncbi:ArsR/SmtB family transcription factor [Bacillus atrophaeus]